MSLGGLIFVDFAHNPSRTKLHAQRNKILNNYVIHVSPNIAFKTFRKLGPEIFFIIEHILFINNMYAHTTLWLSSNFLSLRNKFCLPYLSNSSGGFRNQWAKCSATLWWEKWIQIYLWWKYHVKLYTYIMGSRVAFPG